MSQQRSSTLLTIAAAAVLLLLLYFGSYFALVTRNERGRSSDSYWVEYRFGGKAAESLFSPVHRLDRHVRPSYWIPPRHIDVELSEFGDEVEY